MADAGVQKSDARASALILWRRILEKDPSQARAAIAAAMTALMRGGMTHPFDLARCKSQMMNGVSTPGEFGGGEHGTKMA